MRGSEMLLPEVETGVGREEASRGNRGVSGRGARMKAATERGNAVGTGTEEKRTGTGSENAGAWTEMSKDPESGSGPMTDEGETRAERETETETGPGRSMAAGLEVLTESSVTIVLPAERTPPLAAAGRPLPCPLGL